MRLNKKGNSVKRPYFYSAVFMFSIWFIIKVGRPILHPEFNYNFITELCFRSKFLITPVIAVFLIYTVLVLFFKKIGNINFLKKLCFIVNIVFILVIFITVYGLYKSNFILYKIEGEEKAEVLNLNHILKRQHEIIEEQENILGEDAVDRSDFDFIF